MISFIKGKKLEIDPTKIIIDVNDLGYACYISTNTYDNLPSIGKEIPLLTYFHVSKSNKK